MSRSIAQLSNGTIIEYDKGGFDYWCIFVTIPGSVRYAPTDVEYFTFFKNLCNHFNNDDIYADFESVYNLTNTSIDSSVIQHINNISTKYVGYQDEFELWMTVMYAGMVSEENKENTRLGKRIKRLGFHQVIKDDMAQEIAANYTVGMGWREIDNHCKKRGF